MKKNKSICNLHVINMVEQMLSMCNVNFNIIELCPEYVLRVLIFFVSLILYKKNVFNAITHP